MFSSKTGYSIVTRHAVPQIAAITALLASPAAHATYWNVFNIEGESSLSAQFVIYESASDMLLDENRTGVFTPTNSFGRNIVASGAFVPSASVPEPQSIALFFSRTRAADGERPATRSALGICLGKSVQGQCP